MAGEESSNAFAAPSPITEPPPRRPLAWQPFTPRGVAAFAFTTYNRLFWIQMLFALGAGATVVWFLLTSWAPVIRAAVRNLPDQGIIRAQRLYYPESAPDVLAENRFLGIQVRRDEFSTTAAGADVRVEFYPHAVRVCSILGCAAWLYAADMIAPFTRQELTPWWAAWEPWFLGIAGILVGSAWIVLWHMLATLLCPLVKLIAYFADREVTFGGSWRIAGAAMLPGIAILMIAMALYGIGAVDVLRFAVGASAGVLLQFTYLIWAPFALPRISAALAKHTNPFALES